MMLSPMMESNKHQFCFVEKRKVADPEGGFIDSWEDGAVFDIYVSHDSTIQAQVAESERTASTYTFLIPQGINLAFPDVVRRLSDRQTFRITTPSSESQTPQTSMLNLSMVKAEKWELTSNE